QVKGRAAHAHDGNPVVAVGGAVDVVRVAGQVGNDDLDLALLGPVEPIAADPAGPAFGKQQRLPVGSHADAIGKDQVLQGRVRALCLGVVANDAAVAAPFQAVDG